MRLIDDIPDDRPVLIAGPTASGKSALALRIAEAGGGVIVNADAIQVFACWRVLTARPGPEDLARAPHALYGHVPCDFAYSVGHWLREVADIVHQGARPIIVGGTGLYFRALTEGLADIPATPPEIRAEADALMRDRGVPALLAALDPDTAARIDRQNPMRVQRAWEVQRNTGRGLASWQDDTPPPLLPLDRATPLLVEAGKEWLNARIARRFDAMLAQGALDEARALLPRWDPALPAAKAIGAPELVAHLRGELSLDEAREAATIATRQFAKRQRTWFRARMGGWTRIAAQNL
ncbi:tRNA (adenosine(37)-N6)-dimethylallyltransferase MiaA [Lutimaribacter sp. EGI FJ00015]|uniref:tRNA (Adenosine(37)-N6)-dimethylallyltransferase MiaA n=1 Tax=Lutimaribacter degradans TaxID=2945989 RepID=A0ACC5ZWJ7_9RHOB|nr:tRNA (adenosine(37)-N6)-dimethylallyltransferase MiaA [Lutimaribacter sp. EGI FJ00013]MCM2562455.1 tRNA (adenosine(37)-N6)-dimethylallyltransferase MiaA [Lutimaribacter sp. EGI FJ00013]MCO0613612.1 tRNA (adenosine(37)-N6)-dimethylallyltransferase MiaA [Lutimaribacter sp. EGI FJ00015]MCO0636584.1 tRNA (adenosine(37)-N6)-dimethylallyltransferase MiaA [Lutimaribacter sp. EGI FJ00014]